MADNIPFHAFDIDAFPADTAKLLQSRVDAAAKLKAIDEAIDTHIAKYAGKLDVPVQVDNGKRTKTGNIVWEDAADGSRMMLPASGATLAVSFKYTKEGEVKFFSQTKAKTAKKENSNRVAV